MATPEQLADSKRAVVVAAAGCGKTELLVRAVSLEKTGKQLILTHTHAGVRSLRDRLHRLKVPNKVYSLDTIAGFSLKYASSFPDTSGGITNQYENQNWIDVYKGAKNVLEAGFGKDILEASYSGVYVDEYQDCIILQHELIMTLSEVLPCRVLGDPLQGIFEFSGSPLVDWDSQVYPYFTRLPDLTTPWRWKGNNEELGTWLSQTRELLLRGDTVDLSNLPNGVVKKVCTHDAQRDVCFHAARNNSGNTVAIHKWPNEAHSLARLLGGAFTSMEEVECRDLLKWARKLESDTPGKDLAVHLIDFSSECLTKVSTELNTIKRKITADDFSTKRIRNNRNILELLAPLETTKNWADILNCLIAIKNISSTKLFRPELWYDMLKAVRQRITSNQELAEIAWHIRDTGRYMGRHVRNRCISRTLLIKGLEFNHSIILNADNLSTKELYVAMTRGSNSLTILTKASNRQV